VSPKSYDRCLFIALSSQLCIRIGVMHRVAQVHRQQLRLVTDRVSTGGNSIALVRPSVRLSVTTLTFELSVFDLDILQVYDRSGH